MHATLRVLECRFRIQQEISIMVTLMQPFYVATRSGSKPRYHSRIVHRVVGVEACTREYNVDLDYTYRVVQKVSCCIADVISSTMDQFEEIPLLTVLYSQLFYACAYKRLTVH